MNLMKCEMSCACERNVVNVDEYYPQTHDGSVSIREVASLVACNENLTFLLHSYIIHLPRSNQNPRNASCKCSNADRATSSTPWCRFLVVLPSFLSRYIRPTI